MKLSRWILKIHLYGGLLCFWYLIIIAISSLHYHHHFEFMMENDNPETLKQIKLDMPESQSDSVMAKNVLQALDVPGWDLPWETRTDSSGIFHTVIQNSRKRYEIAYDNTSSIARIAVKDNGFWSVINGLHGNIGKMPKAPLLRLWGVFTYVSLASVIFSILSGIWLWTNRRGNKLIAWFTLLGIMGISISLMIFVYLKG